MQEEIVSKLCGAVMNFFGKTVTRVDETVKFVKRKSKVGAQTQLDESVDEAY